MATLTHPHPLRRDPDDPAPWQVLADGALTRGGLVVGEARMTGGTPGPHLHVHTHEDEAAYVIEGVLTFQVGDDRFEAGPGELVWMPRAVPHAFANLSDRPVRVLGMITPAGLEAMFDELAELDTIGGVPADVEAALAIQARYGVRRVGGQVEVQR